MFDFNNENKMIYSEIMELYPKDLNTIAKIHILEKTICKIEKSVER
tara:strand:+ start:6590 stop:6727 length:138 start_codon:yes stop_codon:yes gene_type:complete